MNGYALNNNGPQIQLNNFPGNFCQILFDHFYLFIYLFTTVFYLFVYYFIYLFIYVFSSIYQFN